MIGEEASEDVDIDTSPFEGRGLVSKNDGWPRLFIGISRVVRQIG